MATARIFDSICVLLDAQAGSGSSRVRFEPGVREEREKIRHPIRSKRLVSIHRFDGPERETFFGNWDCRFIAGAPCDWQANPASRRRSVA
jgi:hypothetical protein